MATDQTLQSYQLTPANNHPQQGDDGSVNGNYPFFQVNQDSEAALRGVSIDDNWQQYAGLTGVAFAYISATQFSMGSVNFTAAWRVGSQVQAFVTAGTIYGTITASVFAGGLMTVTVEWLNGAELDSGLTEVRLSAVHADGQGSLPSSVLTQNNAPNYCAITNVDAAWTGTLAPPILAYQVGATYKFLFSGAASQGSDTVALNSLSAIPLTKQGSTPLAAGDIESGQIAEFIYDGTNFQLVSAVAVAVVTSLPGARNLVGVTQSTATQFAVTADIVVLASPDSITSTTILALNATVDIATSGPALNGRDQGGSFTANETIHLYAIGGGGQTPGLIASAVGPSTGPTLPADYTSWAYLGTFILNGSSDFFSCYLSGNRVSYVVQQQVLTNGANGPTGVANLSGSVVPAEALTLDLQVELSIVGGSGLTETQAQAKFGLLASSTSGGPLLSGSGGGNSTNDIDLFDIGWVIPNTQAEFQFYYTCTTRSGSSTVTANAWVRGYAVPNNS